MANKDYKELLPKFDHNKKPRHIGIIMDGNGRWAKKRLRPRIFGHRAGADAIREVLELNCSHSMLFPRKTGFARRTRSTGC